MLAALVALTGCLFGDAWIEPRGLVLQNDCEGRGSVPAERATVTLVEEPRWQGTTGPDGMFNVGMLSVPPFKRTEPYHLDVSKEGCRPLRQAVPDSAVRVPWKPEDLNVIPVTVTLTCDCPRPST